METNLSNMHFVSIQKNQRVWRLKKVDIPISSSKRRHFLCERKVFVIFKLLYVFFISFCGAKGNEIYSIAAARFPLKCVQWRFRFIKMLYTP
jgi:hypothetical protein